jgi:hypothetical protein
MPAAVLLVLLLAGLLALVPVWRLRAAAWPPAWLFAAWLTYAVLILVVMRFATLTRFMLPLLVVLYLAPFIAGPERLARLVPRRPVEEPRPVIDVTPQPAASLPPAERPRSRGRVLRADPPGGEALDVFSASPGPDDPDPAEGEAT